MCSCGCQPDRHDSKGYDMDELKQARDQALQELGVTDAS